MLEKRAVIFLAAGLIAGLIIGRGSKGTAGGDRASHSGEQNPHVVLKTDRPLRAASSDQLLDQVRTATPERLPELTFSALETWDPIERERLLSECLAGMTYENRDEIVSQFLKVSVETGRDHANEWKLALFRRGQLAGEETMEMLLANGKAGNEHEPWQTLYGWASKEPRNALAYLEKLESSGKAVPVRYYEALLAGAALGDPATAIELANSIPGDRKGVGAGHLVWNLVQHGGIDALEPLIDSFNPNPADNSNPNSTAFANNALEEAAGKMLWAAGHGEGDVARALSTVEQFAEAGMKPDALIHQALGNFSKQPLVARLDLLDSLLASDSFSDLQPETFLGSVLHGDIGEELRTWADGHPDSPVSSVLRQHPYYSYSIRIRRFGEN